MRQININGTLLNITEDIREFDTYKDDPDYESTIDCMYNVMRDTLNEAAIFHNRITEGQTDQNGRQIPMIKASECYLTNVSGFFAVTAPSGFIIISGDVILMLSDVISYRFTDEWLRAEGFSGSLSPQECRAIILQYACRFIALHEQYHIWHHHHEWRSKYRFTYDGTLIQNVSNVQALTEKIITDEPLSVARGMNPFQRVVRELGENRITLQALEMDADCSAVKTLAMLPGVTADVSGDDEERRRIFNEEIPYTVAGIVASIYVMDKRRAKVKFRELKDRLWDSTHPIPAIRLFYMEGEFWSIIAKFMDEETKDKVFNKCSGIVMDLEDKSIVNADSWNIFYYVAYTEAAQNHVILLRKRFNAIIDSLNELSEGIRLSPFAEEDLRINPLGVWFDENGNSIREWNNPLTGTKKFIT